MDEISLNWHEYYIVKSHHEAGMIRASNVANKRIVAQGQPSAPEPEQEPQSIPESVEQTPVIPQNYNPNAYYNLHPEKRAADMEYDECWNCDLKSDQCQCDPCKYCGNSLLVCWYDGHCDYCVDCEMNQQECVCEICSFCDLKMDICICDRCSACGLVVDEECECDRCGECNWLVSECECEKCEYCENIKSACVCDQCSECENIIYECICEKCDECGNTVKTCIDEGYCERCTECEELDRECSCVEEAQEKIDEIEREWEGRQKPFAHWFEEDEDRYVESYVPTMSETDWQISYIIENVAQDKFGYKVTDYSKGIVTDKHGRSVKVGRALRNVLKFVDNDQILDMLRRMSYNAEHFSEESDLKKYLMDSLSKAPAMNNIFKEDSNYHLVISQYPRDIVEMSYDKPWDSCMNIRGGSNRKHVFCEARTGSLVAYLVEDCAEEEIMGTDSLYDTIARIHIKRFVNKDGISIAIPEKRMYTLTGNAVPGFYEAVCSWIKEKQGVVIPGVYSRDRDSYSDSLRQSYMVLPNNDEEFIRALNSGSPEEIDNILRNFNRQGLQGAKVSDRMIKEVKNKNIESNGWIQFESFVQSFPQAFETEDAQKLDGKPGFDIIRPMIFMRPEAFDKGFVTAMCDVMINNLKDIAKDENIFKRMGEIGVSFGNHSIAKYMQFAIKTGNQDHAEVMQQIFVDQIKETFANNKDRLPDYYDLGINSALDHITESAFAEEVMDAISDNQWIFEKPLLEIRKFIDSDAHYYDKAGGMDINNHTRIRRLGNDLNESINSVKRYMGERKSLQLYLLRRIHSMTSDLYSHIMNSITDEEGSKREINSIPFYLKKAMNTLEENMEDLRTNKATYSHGLTFNF